VHGQDLRVERLAGTHVLGQFDCGEPALNDYLKRFAFQSQTEHYAVTYVAVSAARAVGFVTIAPSQITRAELMAADDRMPRYPLPALTLARLATDGAWRGVGVGTMLLRHALLEALRMAEEFGCMGIRLAAKPDAVGFYERFGFVPLTSHASAGERPGDSAPTPMFLPLNQVEDALG
jgi:GNAT superfamily N-acetyltransferase